MRIVENEEYKSKKTYGQTRGLSDLEMKHFGKRAIIGALLKDVKTNVKTNSNLVSALSTRLYRR